MTSYKCLLNYLYWIIHLVLAQPLHIPRGLIGSLIVVVVAVVVCLKTVGFALLSTRCGTCGGAIAVEACGGCCM